MAENNIILKATDIVKSYSSRTKIETPVLRGLSIDIRHGEFLSIMGPSGVGKSTLLYILGLLDKTDTGDVEMSLDGKSFIYSKLRSEEMTRLRNQNIGFIFQFHHLLPEFTAIENIMMPALIAGTSYKTAENLALDLLNKVGVSLRRNHKPMELSGGEQQRIAIARALINNPTLVLADEPTGNLDTKTASSVLELIQNLRDEYNLTFVVATHSNEVAAVSERIVLMGDGRIINDQTKTEYDLQH